MSNDEADCEMTWSETGGQMTKSEANCQIVGTEAGSVADPGCLSRIPDPTFFHPGSRIPDLGSELSPSQIPDPGSSSKNLSILTPKKLKNGF